MLLFARDATVQLHATDIITKPTTEIVDFSVLLSLLAIVRRKLKKLMEQDSTPH